MIPYALASTAYIILIKTGLDFEQSAFFSVLLFFGMSASRIFEQLNQIVKILETKE